MNRALRPFVCAVVIAAGSLPAIAQSPPSAPPRQPPAIFFGSVPAGQATAEPLPLSILDAINRALEHNLGILLPDERAAGLKAHAGGRSERLLPTINGRVTETRQMVDLAAYGFPLPAGIPPIVGPFNVFDAQRVFASQSVFDLRASTTCAPSGTTWQRPATTISSARDLVVLVAGERVSRRRWPRRRAPMRRARNCRRPRRSTTRRVDSRQSGLVAGIDVLRAEVQLSTERQRVTAAANEFEKAKLQLARVIGLPLGQAFTLSDELPTVPVPDMTLEQALERAYKTRPDYQAALERVQAPPKRRARGGRRRSAAVGARERRLRRRSA